MHHSLLTNLYNASILLVLSHCLNFQDPFAAHLKIDNLIPHFRYRVLFSSLNTYSIIPESGAEFTYFLAETKPGGL